MVVKKIETINGRKIEVVYSDKGEYLGGRYLEPIPPATGKVVSRYEVTKPTGEKVERVLVKTPEGEMMYYDYPKVEAPTTPPTPPKRVEEVEEKEEEEVTPQEAVALATKAAEETMARIREERVKGQVPIYAVERLEKVKTPEGYEVRAIPMKIPPFGLGLTEKVHEKLEKVGLKPEKIEISEKPTRAERFVETYPKVLWEVTKAEAYGLVTFVPGILDIGISFVKNPLFTIEEMGKGLAETGFVLADPIAGILRPERPEFRATPEKVMVSAWGYGKVIGTIAAGYAMGKTAKWAKKKIEEMKKYEGFTKEEWDYFAIDELTTKERASLLKQLEAVRKGKTQPKIKELESVLEKMPRLRGKSKEVLEFLQDENVILGGSAGTKTQMYGKARTPHDLDIYTYDYPESLAEKFWQKLTNFGEDKRFKLTTDTEIRTYIGGRWKTVAHFHSIDDFLASHPYYTGKIVATPDGVKVITLYEQVLRKVPGAFGLAGEERIRKDLIDTLSGVSTLKERMKIEVKTAPFPVSLWKEFKLERFEEALAGVRFGRRGYITIPTKAPIYPITGATILAGLAGITIPYPKEEEYPKLQGLPGVYPIYPKEAKKEYPITYPKVESVLTPYPVYPVEKKPTYPTYPKYPTPDKVLYPTYYPPKKPAYPYYPTYPIKKPPIPPPKEEFIQKIYDLGKITRKRAIIPRKLKRPKKEYRPSLIGLGLPVYGKMPKMLTGMEIRPIIGKPKKTKKRKRDVASILIGV